MDAKIIFDFITMNSKQQIHFHKFRMQMVNSLLRMCMNSYTRNPFLFAKLQIYLYKFVTVSSVSVYEWPIL